MIRIAQEYYAKFGGAYTTGLMDTYAWERLIKNVTVLYISMDLKWKMTPVKNTFEEHRQEMNQECLIVSCQCKMQLT